MDDIKVDKDWKAEAQSEKLKMAEADKDTAWISLEEVQAYLTNVKETLERVAQEIQNSLDHVEARVKSEGDTNND
jgi:hypothetical protein